MITKITEGEHNLATYEFQKPFMPVEEQPVKQQEAEVGKRKVGSKVPS